MKIYNDLVIFRGGGDVATGSIQKLHRAGFKVLVLEIAKPTVVRKTVALCEAVYNKVQKVEDVTAVLCDSILDIEAAFNKNLVAIYIDPKCKILNEIKPLALVDAIIAKKNLGTNREMAPITIALGPGFSAPNDVDVVIETNRGHDLGRLIFEGSASPNTGVPGNINGFSSERVFRAPIAGKVIHNKKIGDLVKKDDVLCYVNEEPVRSKIDGLIRGLIENGIDVKKGVKLGDVDPRLDVDYYTISDKARNIGGAVLEAVLYMKNKLNV